MAVAGDSFLDEFLPITLGHGVSLQVSGRVTVVRSPRNPRTPAQQDHRLHMLVIDKLIRRAGFDVHDLLINQVSAPFLERDWHQYTVREMLRNGDSIYHAGVGAWALLSSGVHDSWDGEAGSSHISATNVRGSVEGPVPRGLCLFLFCFLYANGFGNSYPPDDGSNSNKQPGYSNSGYWGGWYRSG